MDKYCKINYLTWVTSVMKALLVICVIGMSWVPIVSSLVCAVQKITVSTIHVNCVQAYYTRFVETYVPYLDVLLKDLVLSVSLVLLSIHSLHLFLFSFGVLLFSFEIGNCWWWLLWPNTSLNISRKSFSKVGRDLSSSKLYRFYFNFVFITNMYSFGPYLIH